MTLIRSGARLPGEAVVGPARWRSSALRTVRLGLPEILITAGYAGLFFVVTARALSRAPILARHDPFLAESLRHHQ